MENQVKPKRFKGWACAGIFFGGIILLAGLFAIWFLTPIGKPKPTIQIIQPDSGIIIESGDGLVLNVNGESRNGFKELQLYVNDQLYHLHTALDPQLRNLDVNLSWFSSQPGIHKISVIGLNNSERSSEPASLLVAVTPRDLYSTSQDMDVEGLENIDDPSQQGDEDMDVIDPDSQTDEEVVEIVGGDEIDPSIGLGNEQPQENLDEFLGNINLNGEFPLDWLNQPVDNIPVIDQFNVQSHPGGDESAEYSVSASDDLGIALILFYLSDLADPFSPEITQFSCGNQVNCRVEDSVQLSQGSWGLSVQAVDSSGQVSELLSRQVHILEGEDPQAVAIGFLQNILSSGMFQINPALQDVHIDLINTVDDISSPEITRYECSGNSVILRLSYLYLSDHGDVVYVGANAKNGDTVIASGHSQIGPGVGYTDLKMALITPEIGYQTSDQLKLFLRVGENNFYEEVIDFEVNWPKPLPDLIITGSNQAGELASVDIRNDGCAVADLIPLRFTFPDGQMIRTVIYTPINPGNEYVWTDSVDPNLFSMGYEVTVDAYGVIEEINETNNSYIIDPMSIKYIEFYKLIIHDTKEGVWRGPAGEFILSGRIDDFHFRRPSNTNSVWKLNGGEYDLTGFLEPMVFYPEPASNDYVYIFVRAEEDDDWRTEWMGDIQFSHSPDFYNETSWKRGGNFSATSSEEDFTMFWRIVLNER